MKLITVKMTPGQSAIVAKALDIYMRAQMGQYDIIKSDVEVNTRLDTDIYNVLSAFRYASFVSSGRKPMGCVDESYINLSNKDNLEVYHGDTKIIP